KWKPGNPANVKSFATNLTARYRCPPFSTIGPKLTLSQPVDAAPQLPQTGPAKLSWFEARGLLNCWHVGEVPCRFNATDVVTVVLVSTAFQEAVL
ncbi:MAG: hypothetical protein K8F25_08375, partial [Fimbriimonadaceae bacterium]|nr:hypothetical protein [Alphaproteobacteria bacterium]